MRVNYMEEEYGRFSTIDAIKEWWKVRNYIRSEDESLPADISEKKKEEVSLSEGTTPEKVDPIQEVLKKPRAPRKKKAE